MKSKIKYLDTKQYRTTKTIAKIGTKCEVESYQVKKQRKIHTWISQLLKKRRKRRRRRIEQTRYIEKEIDRIARKGKRRKRKK